MIMQIETKEDEALRKAEGEEFDDIINKALKKFVTAFSKYTGERGDIVRIVFAQAGDELQRLIPADDFLEEAFWPYDEALTAIQLAEARLKREPIPSDK